MACVVLASVAAGIMSTVRLSGSVDWGSVAAGVTLCGSFAFLSFLSDFVSRVSSVSFVSTTLAAGHAEMTLAV